QKSFQQAPANLKQTQVAPIGAVDPMALAALNGPPSAEEQPDIDQRHPQQQAGQAFEMIQVCMRQVKAMSFQVAKQLLGPHAAAIRSQGLVRRRQIGRQQPGLGFAALPRRQQVDGILEFGGQASMRPPSPLASVLNQTPKGLPRRTPSRAHLNIALVAQDIAPTPCLQLPLYLHSPKFAIPDQQDGYARGNQLMHISQQRPLF